MGLFKNILVGVDIAQAKKPSAEGLSPLAREAVLRGIDLARRNSAKLTFFSALNISEEVLRHLEAADQQLVAQSVADTADKVLHDLVKQAAAEGADAHYKAARGKGWLEIIRQVLRDHHDLVVVGTRDFTGIRRMLMGNTAMKLFRRCPCPVLVTKTGAHTIHDWNVLIAADLKPASQEALRVGIAHAHMLGARVHVLHILEYPLDRLWSTGLPDAKQAKYHQNVRHEAEQLLQHQLSKTDYKTLGDRLHIHMVDGVGLADVAIQHFIQVHHINLLVMGSIGRGGVPGVMIGNTAERLLPEVGCSVLAVKPPDFKCPVSL
jgi:universal stress protein E